MGITGNIEDAVVSLSEAFTINDLVELFRHGITKLIANVLSTKLWLLPLDSLLSDKSSVQYSLAEEAVLQRQRIVRDFISSYNHHHGCTDNVATVADSTSFAMLMDIDQSAAAQWKLVCSPMVDSRNDEIVAVSLIVCNSLSEDDHGHLAFLEKQFVACYRRIKYQMAAPPVDFVSPAESLLKMCASLHDVDSASLQLKVLRFLQQQTSSANGFLLLVDSECQQLLCQVTCDKILEGEVIIPVNQSGLTAMFHNKMPMTFADIGPGNLDDVRNLLNCTVSSSACFPVICRVTGEVMAVVCLVNKTDGSESYTEQDKAIVDQCFTYTATVLYSAIAVQHERRLKKHTESLLGCARNLFSHLEELPKLLREIMTEAKKLTNAERCSVFLLETKSNDLVAEVFDGGVGDLTPSTPSRTSRKGVRLPTTSGIVGYVATTGEMLNIEDAYSHPLFYNGVDESTGFRTRNILSFPLKDPAGGVVGVAQLCNKVGGGVFTKFDEMIAQGFSVLCSISVMHSMLYQKVKDAQARVQLSNELMMYHMLVTNDEVHMIASIDIPSPTSFLEDMAHFTCIPRNIPVEDTVLTSEGLLEIILFYHGCCLKIEAVISMMADLGFISHFQIPREYLTRFVLMAKRGYRDPPYHNWYHAFAVVHFCYLLLKNVPWQNYMDDIEALALFMSCLCHDIDHRGTNNAYQKASGSLLHTLYSSEGSMLERHHFAQTMCILNTDGCNIYENLSREDYIQILDLMQDIILATDISQHMAILPNLQKMADEGYHRDDKQHRKLLIRLMMTACDLSDQTKSFRHSQTTAELIYSEFFNQGDLEKDIGQQPMEFMDRERAIIPNLQINFIDTIALPVYRLLAKMMPEVTSVLQVVENNREMWSAVNDELLKQNLPRNMAMFRHLDSIFNASV